ncbi:hypothetical protein EMO89_00430 [Bifidobacterium tissieri]|uniref:Uncharacterized protein n=1 Tax=Bifidobacterium tissieri TaxID=1630162 RepID=A0A5M9ZX66_9BIFI|nr:hypothetical protein [Bifidobacterium tissieri]KAA8832029.1 hypothetical protein EMO89_00430 [Bifidobacterium tissieri]
MSRNDARRRTGSAADGNGRSREWNGAALAVLRNGGEGPGYVDAHAAITTRPEDERTDILGVPMDRFLELPNRRALQRFLSGAREWEHPVLVHVQVSNDSTYGYEVCDAKDPRECLASPYQPHRAYPDRKSFDLERDWLTGDGDLPDHPVPVSVEDPDDEWFF